MWEFYLAAAEMAFREQAMMVFQIQLTKRQGVVPMTRDYMMRETERLRAPKAASGRRCGWPASDSRPPPPLPAPNVKRHLCAQFSTVDNGDSRTPRFLCGAVPALMAVPNGVQPRKRSW